MTDRSNDYAALGDLLVSTFRLAIHDIEHGNGTATVTLRSGVRLSGKVNLRLTNDVVLQLNTSAGWHTIDWVEIAALTGEADG